MRTTRATPIRQQQRSVACTQVNKRYSHGVGKVRARDKTSGTPVTTFKRSNALYSTAMNNNRGLDRDRDAIACEKL